MKNNKILKIIMSSLITILLVAGCEKDLLEQVNPNALSTGSFWKSGDDAYNAVVGIYAVLPESSFWGGFWTATYVCRSDETNPLPGDVFFNSYFAPKSSHWSIERPWNRYYRGIFRANLLLENVPDIEMDENRKAIIMGEAYFLRGLYYFDLLTYFHKIPLLTETPKEIDDYYPVQADPSEVWAQIESDLKQAQEVLPDNWDTDNLGRATWGAATVMLGKTYLYQHKYSEASAEFKKVVDSEIYELVSDYRDNFTSVNENNKESLFEIQVQGDQNFRGWSGETASRGLASVFETFFMAPVKGTTAAVQINQWVLDYFLNSTDNEGNIDKRAFATLAWDHPESIIYEGQSFQEYYPSDDVNRVNNKIYCRKWVDYEVHNEQSIRNSRYEGVINVRVLRFADILLMYAEALNEINGPTAEAYKAINEVRKRVNVPEITNDLSKEEFFNVIKKERILELSLEGKRFFDLMRWGELEKAYNVDHPDCKSNSGASFTSNRDEYLPIPQQEIDAHPQELIKQNPGY